MIDFQYVSHRVKSAAEAVFMAALVFADFLMTFYTPILDKGRLFFSISTYFLDKNYML